MFTSVGLDRSPAYLEVSADGVLVDWGGHIGTYGLGGLIRGRSAQDQVVLLQGLLPTAGHEICLPCVRVGGGAPADVHVFRHENADWVLLLDASAYELRLRCVQQMANEYSLSRESPPLASSVLRALDMVVLERTRDDRLVPVSDPPSWLTAALPGASRFLENFMIDAEAQWRLDREGASVRSGRWHEDGLMSAGEWWDATALRLHGRNLMVITRSSAAAAESQRALQGGRERGLALASRTAELAAASSRFEVEHAERQRTAARNRLLAHAVESTHEMISVTDLDDCFTFVNRSFLDGYGYTEDEVLGRHVGLVVSPANPADVMTQVLQATRSGGWAGELVNRRKDGTDFPVSLNTKPIRAETGLRDRVGRRGARHHGTETGGRGPARRRGAVAAGAEDGGHRPAGRRRGPRLQQPADRHHRLRRAAARAHSEPTTLAARTSSEIQQGRRARRGAHPAAAGLQPPAGASAAGPRPQRPSWPTWRRCCAA